MKKLIIRSFVLIVVSTNAFAQKNQREINREYGRKYEEINSDSSLTPYEKSEKKRELAIKQKQDNIEYNKENYHTHHHNIDYKDERKKDIERKIDLLEDRYKRDKERIDNNDKLNKRKKNAQKKILEKDYKSKKDLLKREKENIK